MQAQLDRINTIMVQMSEQLSQLNIRDRDRERNDFLNSSQSNPNINDIFQTHQIPSQNIQNPNVSHRSQGDRTSNLSANFITNSSKVANLINSWHVTFSGVNSQMPVERFIYMINSLVADSKAGDFSLLSEHSHLLFTAKAKDWY